MRSGNPTLSGNAFSRAAATSTSGGVMTVQGTINKTLILLGISIFVASLVFANPAQWVPFVLPAAIIGFIVALVTCFKLDWAPVTAPVYAGFEGIVLGGVSMMFEQAYPGIVFQAVTLTFGTMFAMLLSYKAGWVKVTDQFRSMLFAATGGIMLVYVIGWLISLFGGSMPFIHSSGPFGILFSLIVVGVAALNLVLDFDFIERGAQSGAPKNAEWYGAFALMVTLIWLYMEILRLLSKLRSR